MTATDSARGAYARQVASLRSPTARGRRLKTAASAGSTPAGGTPTTRAHASLPALITERTTEGGHRA